MLGVLEFCLHLSNLLLVDDNFAGGKNWCLNESEVRLAKEKKLEEVQKKTFNSTFAKAHFLAGLSKIVFKF